jgi:translation initiation factor 1
VAKKGDWKDEPAGKFHDPFAGLAGKLGIDPRPADPAPEPAPRGPARAVVRLERKGRGGKEATVVEKLELSLVERGSGSPTRSARSAAAA